MNEADFETFEETCLNVDGMALVEYAMELRAAGCVVDFGPAGPGSGTGSAGGGHRRLQDLWRRLQGYLTQQIGLSVTGCAWDQMDDIAGDVDILCCGADDSGCPATNTPTAGFHTPTTCSPACAVAMHSFTAVCGSTLSGFLNQDFLQSIQTFEQVRLPPFFL